MPEGSSASARAQEGYLHVTQRPLTCLAFVTGPLLAYQIGSLHYGTELLAPRDLGRLLRYFGATAGYLPALLIVVVLLLQHLFHRHPWRLRPGVLAGMAAESAVWVLPIFSMSYLTSKLLAAGAPPNAPGTTQLVLQAFGAGLYEEFIFRLAVISIVLGICVDLLGMRRDAPAVAAVILGAVAFSLYHLTGEQLAGESPIPWNEFAFRAMAGAYLGGLCILRGFGITVGTHILWNIYAAFWG